MRRLGGTLAVLGGLLLIVPTAAPASAAADGELDGFEYVALGDSYQAGFGLLPLSADPPATTPATDPNGCYQAQQDYPRRLATQFGLAIDDQTCSGAKTANLGYPADTALPVPPSVEVFPDLSAGSELQDTLNASTVDSLQTAALGPTTDIVTVGIGGNDVGFTDIAESCMRLSNDEGTTVTGLEALIGVSVANCKDVFESTDLQYAQYQISTRQDEFITPRIQALFTEIKAQAPNAQVFVVGYPQLATSDPEVAASCFSLTLPPPIEDAVPFSGTDIVFLNQVEKRLVDAVQAEAETFGFHYISAWESTAEHTICDEDPWIEKLDLVMAATSGPPCPADYLPLGTDGQTLACVKLGALHPTEAGVENLHQLTAAKIQSAFHVEAPAGGAAAGARMAVTGGGYYPGEPVEIWLNSDPVLLGILTADAAGSISGEVQVPADVSIGAHTLVATGQTSAHSFSSAVEITAGSVDPALLLPATGSDTAPMVIAGVVFLIAGALVTALDRRQRRRHG